MVCYFVIYVPGYIGILPDLLQVVKFRVSVVRVLVSLPDGHGQFSTDLAIDLRARVPLDCFLEFWYI
jgi:hypothetical protein